MARAIKKTTLDLDIDLYKRLKQHSLDTDKSIREIITEALVDKLTRDARRDGPGAPGGGRSLKRNPVADAILTELLSVFPEELAVRLLAQKCAESAVTPEALRPGDLTPGFIEGLARPVDMMSPGRAQDFTRKLATLGRGGA